MAEGAVLHQWKPFHCQFCGVRYHRRDYFETWTVSRDRRSHELIYKKEKLRCCLECAAHRHHERFVRVPDVMLLRKTVE